MIVNVFLTLHVSTIAFMLSTLLNFVICFGMAFNTGRKEKNSIGWKLRNREEIWGQDNFEIFNKVNLLAPRDREREEGEEGETHEKYIGILRNTLYFPTRVHASLRSRDEMRQPSLSASECFYSECSDVSWSKSKPPRHRKMRLKSNSPAQPSRAARVAVRPRTRGGTLRITSGWRNFDFLGRRFPLSRSLFLSLPPLSIRLFDFKPRRGDPCDPSSTISSRPFPLISRKGGETFLHEIFYFFYRPCDSP